MQKKHYKENIKTTRGNPSSHGASWTEDTEPQREKVIATPLQCNKDLQVDNPVETIVKPRVTANDEYVCIDELSFIRMVVVLPDLEAQ